VADQLPCRKKERMVKEYRTIENLFSFSLHVFVMRRSLLNKLTTCFASQHPAQLAPTVFGELATFSVATCVSRVGRQESAASFR